MFAFRNVLNVLAIAARVNEQQRRQETFAARAFDIGSIPWTKRKGSRRKRHVGHIDRIVIHVTGVHGGFGVSKRLRKRWERTVEIGRVDTDLVAQLVEARANRFGDGKLAQRLALWERYRNTPYHEIAAANGDVLRNRRLAQRSYHAGKGNDGAGLAIDCAHDEELDDWLIETGRAAFSDLVRRLRRHGDPNRELLVGPHRATSGQRRLDPNVGVWREIVLPMVESLQPNIVIDYEWKLSTGRQVPDVWDPDALYDSRGRRL